MSPETRKHLYVGAAIITLAGAAIWMYQKAKGASSGSSATDGQATQDNSSAMLGELALGGGFYGGGGGGFSSGAASPGVSTVSPNTVTAPGTDIATELASIFSSLGIGNPTSPASATPPASTPPASTSNPTSLPAPTAPHTNILVAKETVPVSSGWTTFSGKNYNSPQMPVTTLKGLTYAQLLSIKRAPVVN